MHTSKNTDPFAGDEAKHPAAQLQSCLLPVGQSSPPWGGYLSRRGAQQGLRAKAKHGILLSLQLPFPGGCRWFLKACVSKWRVMQGRGAGAGMCKHGAFGGKYPEKVFQ